MSLAMHITASELKLGIKKIKPSRTFQNLEISSRRSDTNGHLDCIQNKIFQSISFSSVILSNH